MKVKDIGTISAKWSTRAQAATQDYVNGTAGVQQAEPAIAAVGTWQQAVQSPTAATAYTKGLTASGDAGWQAGVKAKGATRYGPGVQGAQGKYSQGEQPYLQALSNLTLPPRGLRRSPQNMARVQAVVTAMGQVKTAGAA
jgi:hypothetical protein